MDSSTVKKIVEDELARGESSTNFHGITPQNIRSFLVEPFAVRTDPDDTESQPREMWIVLQEGRTPTEGYVVVYDPTDRTWGVAEHTGNGDYILIVSSSSLAEALSDMRPACGGNVFESIPVGSRVKVAVRVWRKYLVTTGHPGIRESQTPPKLWYVAGEPPCARCPPTKIE